MQKNLSFLSRAARVLLSVGLIAWAIAGGPFWAFLGLYPMATGAWGYCPVTDFLKNA